MGGRGRESCGLERSLDNSLMVVCGDEVMVVAAHNAAAADDVVVVVDVAAMDDVAAAVDVTATDGVVVAVGATAMVVVWVLWCWMRPCTSLQSHFVSVAMTLRGNEPL